MGFRSPLVLLELWDVGDEAFSFKMCMCLPAVATLNQAMGCAQNFMYPVKIRRQYVLHNIPSLHSFVSVLWRNHDYTEDIFVCSRAGLGSALRNVLKEKKNRKEESAQSEQQQRNSTVFVLGKVWDRKGFCGNENSLGENNVECAFFFTSEQLVSGRFYPYIQYFSRLGLYSKCDFKKALLNKLVFHP